MKTRRSGVDYLKELKEIRKDEASLVAHVTQRLIDLVNTHPNAVIDERDGDITYANFLLNVTENLPVEVAINYIIVIEEYLKQQDKIKQLKMY